MRRERLFEIMRENLPPESEKEWWWRTDEIIGCISEDPRSNMADSVWCIFLRRVSREFSRTPTGYRPNVVDQDAVEGRTARELNSAFTPENWEESRKRFSDANAFVLQSVPCAGAEDPV